MRISSKCSLALHILLLLAVYKHDKLTSEIMDAYPQYSYTIISTTEELYQSVDDARPEEIPP